MKVVFFNVSDAIAKALTKYGIRNDRSSHTVNIDQFLFKAGNMLLVPEVRSCDRFGLFQSSLTRFDRLIIG